MAITGILVIWVSFWSTRLVRSLQMSKAWIATLLIIHLGTPLALCMVVVTGQAAIKTNTSWMVAFTFALLAPILSAVPVGMRLTTAIFRFYQDRLPARMRTGPLVGGVGGRMTLPIFGSIELAYETWSIEQDVSFFGLTAARQVDATADQLAFRQSEPPLLDLVLLGPIIWYAWFYDKGHDSPFFAILLLIIVVARNAWRIFTVKGRHRKN